MHGIIEGFLPVGDLVFNYAKEIVTPNFDIGPATYSNPLAFYRNILGSDWNGIGHVLNPV
jgi:hypothetical protein